MNYYNEFDPFAAEWLRELIKEGLIPEGVVDERSITEVDPADVREFTQCHFFAGIGGWSFALALAGWPTDRPIWTGSPPCQPFSVAGNKKGKDDLRHLWPTFFSLINQCKPSAIAGEQVAAAIRHGWFDDLQIDLESEGYAAAMAVLPACSVNAPHKRDRLYYVAERVDDSQHPRLEGYGGAISNEGGWTIKDRPNPEGGISVDWGRSESPRFKDGKRRSIPTEPALFPLANGIPNRVELLRGAGNAIVPQVAAEVIKAYMGVER